MTQYRIFPEHILACYLCYCICLDESKEQVHDSCHEFILWSGRMSIKSCNGKLTLHSLRSL